jgi:hypothetical protein
MSQAQTGVQPLTFKPAGAEWLAALHKAQREAKQIERTKGIPDARGKIKFYIAAAEDFTNESRRVLHAHDMGWFRLDTGIAEINPHTGTLKLRGKFVVYHAPSGQAQSFCAEWTARGDGDAMAGAHTRLTRRFIQGLLQVAVVDEGSEPEDPPTAGHGHAGCSHPPHATFPHGEAQWNAQRACWVSEMVCRACGDNMGWGPCDAPAEQQQALPKSAPPAPPACNPRNAHNGPCGDPACVFGQQTVPVPQKPQHQNTSYVGGPPQQAPLPPVSTEPIVQEAMSVLGAEPVSPQQMHKEQSDPKATAGEAGSPEVWRDSLIAKGLDPENALQIAMLDDARIVEPELVEQMRGWAFSSFGGDVEKIIAAWQAVGFEPVPSLPLDQRPRPTGVQAKKFLSAMTFKPATAGA